MYQNSLIINEGMSKNENTKEQIVKSVSDFLKNNREEILKYYNEIVDTNTEQALSFNTSRIYNNIGLTEYNRELTKVSVVILTANLLERETLNYCAYLGSNRKIKKLNSRIKLFVAEDSRVVDAYIFEINNYTVLHLHAAETGSNTPCGSADLTRYIEKNDYLHPSCIISFGVCYGIDWEKQKIGDTIIAEKIYPWSVGIKLDENGWKIKHDGFIIDIRKGFSVFYGEIDDIIYGQKNDKPNIKFKKATIGNMLTGEAVVSNEEIKIEAIKKAFGFEIIGGEMEGYGLAKECIYYNNTPCIIIKSICDWGAYKNIEDDLKEMLPDYPNKNFKDQLQVYAAQCAFTLLKKLFYENLFDRTSLALNTYEMLMDNYILDEALQEDYLIEIICKYISENYKQINIHSANMSDFAKKIIQSLVELKCFKKETVESIKIYTFKSRRKSK